MRRGVSVLAVFAAIAVVISCRDATEIQLDVHTNLAWRAGIDTAFTVGSPGETEGSFSTTETRASWGADGFVGSLVVVPGGSKSAPLSVKVVMGITRDPHDCSLAQPDGCIFARRTLSYVPHRSLELPIVLYEQCAGVACDSSTTCNFLGQCVSSAIDPSTCDSETGCAAPGDTPLPDGGIPVSDAGDAQADGAGDGGTDATFQVHDAGSTGPAGDIACGSLTCHTGTYCCLNPNTGVGSCPTKMQPCLSTNVVLTCDGPEDCGPNPCCAGTQTASCAATGSACAADTALCHSGATCGGAACKPNAFAGAYGICDTGAGP